MAKRLEAGAKATPDPLPANSGDDLLTILQAIWVDLFGEAYEDTGDLPDLRGLGISFDVANPRVKDVLNQLASRVKQIDDATRTMIQEAVGRMTSEGMTIQQLAAEIRAGNVEAFSASRSRMIARTESGTAYNQGAVLAYRDAGVENVYVMDGDQDTGCAEVNGTTQTLEWADENPLEHPNCVRAFAPVIDVTSEAST